MSTNDPSVPPSQPPEPGPPPQSPGADQPPTEQPAPPPQPGYPAPDAQQPAPSQQPGEYQQQPPPPAAQPEWATQQTGQPGGAVDSMDPKVAGLLSYLIFMWVGGLIMYLTQKNPEVRFHAAQSILTSIALFAIGVALWIVGIVLSFIPVLDILGALLLFLASVGIWIGSFVLWILLCIKGYNLEHFKLPVIGNIAEQWAAK